MSVVIVKTGVANVASVTAALRRCGRLSLLSDDPQVIAEAQHVVLPGVGAFGAALSRLRAGGLGHFPSAPLAKNFCLQTVAANW